MENLEEIGKGKGLTVIDLIVCVVDIFTTEGISFSARSANELGTVLLLCK